MSLPLVGQNHQSLIKYKNQWYLFYHHDDYSPNFDKARSVRADSLFFNDDGTIKKVIPTFRGIGVTNATDTIQLDRYSAKSKKGTFIAFLDSTDTFKGWSVNLEQPNSWVQYNTVNFGNKKLKFIRAKVKSVSGGEIEIHLSSINGPVIGRLKIPKTENWQVVDGHISNIEPGVHNIFIVQKTNSATAIDWIRFQ